MKKLVAMLLTCVMTLGAATAFASEYEPDVFLNGEKMTFDVNPYVENDRTLVPMRAIFEAVGATIQWDEENNTVHAVREKDGEVTVISLQIDTATAFVNSQAKTLDVPAVLKQDRTFVPLRFVVEELGEKVDWDGVNYVVNISTAE